ncbi:MAG TPA: hypothetical protein VK175_02885 [Leadbetterella sp.]|nr:hypothetical protein [Leadbetterella sp.]
MLVKSKKKVPYYFEYMQGTFEGEKRMNKSSQRPFSEFNEEYLSNKRK